MQLPLGERVLNVSVYTAHLLLEVDEAQDVNEEKYTKEFKPIGSTIMLQTFYTANLG